MIEVEIRGKLDAGQFQKLKEFLEKEGSYVGSHDREMILLYDYPGFSMDPNARQTDIRLRKTNDDLEIMVKDKVSDNNIGRKETALHLKNGAKDWETAKQVLKSLGLSRGLWMERNKTIYQYHDIEWSLVDATNGHFYFEAEQETGDAANADSIHAHLIKEAEALGLSALDPEKMKEFIFMLDKAVNKEIEW